MTFKDVLTSNLLDNVKAITLFDMAVTIFLAFCMGLFIMWAYSQICKKGLCSSSFSVSLVALTMISAALILAITSNLVLSLGMVGALSIVRFRTAIKDPLEIVFLFWSIETGIVLATGIIPLGVGVNIAIGVILIILADRKENPYILVIKCKQSAWKKIKEKLDKKAKHTLLSWKSVGKNSVDKSGGDNSGVGNSGVGNSGVDNSGVDNSGVGNSGNDNLLELAMEITLVTGAKKKKESVYDVMDLLNELKDDKDVVGATLVTYNGGYMN